MSLYRGTGIDNDMNTWRNLLELMVAFDVVRKQDDVGYGLLTSRASSV